MTYKRGVDHFRWGDRHEVCFFRAHLERVPGALLFQQSRLEELSDEPLRIVEGVVGVAVRQLQGFVSSQHLCGGEGHGAGDALSPLLVRYHFHLPGSRVEDPHGAERGAQIQADHFRLRRRQVLLAEVTSQKQSQDDRA